MLPLFFRTLLAQQLDGHQDGVQEVVEVVGHAAGQDTDTFQALGAQQLGLKLHALGHIRVDDQNAPGLALVVTHQSPARFGHDLLPRFRDLNPVADPFAVLEQDLAGLVQARHIPLEEQIDGILAEGFLGRPAIQALGPLVPVDDSVLQIAHRDGVVGQVQEGHPFEQLFFNPLPVGCFLP